MSFQRNRDAQSPDATVIIEANADVEDFLQRVETVVNFDASGRCQLLVVCLESDREGVETVLSSRSLPLKTVSLPDADAAGHVKQVVGQIRAGRVAFLSAGGSFSVPQWSELPDNADSLMPWTPDTCLPAVEWLEETRDARGWLASTSLLRSLDGLRALSNWKILRLADEAKRAGLSITWPSARASTSTIEVTTVEQTAPPINRRSSVLAIVPHYRCEEWLAECLEGLVRQSHPLSGIVVIDDGSATPPTEIVKAFPQVTLLASAHNVGAYPLLQQVMDDTNYDAYLMQDADDWSTYDRLEILLAEAERSGAEVVGGQELRIMSDSEQILPVCYPRDVNAALRAKPEAFCLLNGTSVIGRNLWQRLGGLSTGLKVAADMEFLGRASHVARIVNVPRYCYFRRYRMNSITAAVETGHGSPMRQHITRLIEERARRNAELAANGEVPDLRPCAIAPPVELTYLLGPPLNPSSAT